MPVERHGRCGDQDNETIRRLQADLAAAQAEAAVLRGRVLDLTRMVVAEAEPAVQDAIRDGQPPGRHRRPPEARWLRAVPAVVVMAFRPARHKILAGLAAASVAVVVAAPGMDLAPWIAGTPPAQAHARGAPSAAARVLPTPPGKGRGGGVASPPPHRPSSPPGKPGPSPAATPTATATDTPSPEATDTPDTDTPSPSATATGTPDPDPSPTATAAACPPPGKHKG